MAHRLLRCHRVGPLATSGPRIRGVDHLQRGRVVFGTGFTGRSQTKGDQTGAIAVSSIRAALAARRLVVLVDEYNTTACHLECGNKMEKAKHDEHEKFCPVCQMDVDRDLNAGKNIRVVWTSQVTTGCRPAHLRRP